MVKAHMIANDQFLSQFCVLPSCFFQKCGVVCKMREKVAFLNENAGAPSSENI